MDERQDIKPGDNRGVGEGVLSPGDISRDLAESKLMRRAIRECWPISADDKAAIRKKMREKMDKDYVTGLNARGEEIALDNDRNQIAAAKVLMEADKINQVDYWNADKNARLDAGKATENHVVTDGRAAMRKIMGDPEAHRKFIEASEAVARADGAD